MCAQRTRRRTRCLAALLAKTSYPFRLILVNDGSDTTTTAFLRSVKDTVDGVQLIERTDPPHGYTIAANCGLRESSGDYVVLLNSDTIVSLGWLERIVEAGESNGQIGVLGPLSNAASHQSVPALREGDDWAVNELPEWMTVDAMGFAVDHLSARHFPRLPFLNGFCYVIKRRVLDQVGLFDEGTFPSGYCEENDFSLRAVKARLRTCGRRSGVRIPQQVEVLRPRRKTINQEAEL